MSKKRRQDAPARKPDEKPHARPKKAVPPPDDPALRHYADVERVGGGVDEAAQARARIDAIRQTREMSTSDEPQDEQKDKC